MAAPKAPGGLRGPGKRFWKQMTAQRLFEDVHDFARLGIACRTLDEMQADEATLAGEGRFQHDGNGKRIAHPALKSLESNRALFLRVIRELALDLTSPEDSRPPQLY